MLRASKDKRGGTGQARETFGKPNNSAPIAAYLRKQFHG